MGKLTKIGASLAVLAALIAAVAIFSGGSAAPTPVTESPTPIAQKTDTPTPVTSPVATVTRTPAPTQSGISLATVAKHNSRTSCWTAVNGIVYDLTSFIDRHPGGAQMIMTICGKDGSALFKAQHSGQAKPEQELATLKIGLLQ